MKRLKYLLTQMVVLYASQPGWVFFLFLKKLLSFENNAQFDWIMYQH